MFYSFRSKLKYLGYDHHVREVKKLSPKSIDTNSNFILLSMLCKRDLCQYLVALNSLFLFARPKRIIVLNDGSLLEPDTKLLKEKFPDIEIHPITSFRDEKLPVGGCWERITAVADYSAEDYVVQLDADTLFTSAPDEVITAIQSNHSFALPTDSGTEIIRASKAIEYAIQNSSPNDHIQLALEAKLSIMGDPEQINYIRACAGFAGYAPGTITREKLIQLSTIYSKEFGNRWLDWGTEQFASNYLLANWPDTVVLPNQQYNSVNVYHDRSLKFIHFIGSHRFNERLYHKLSKEIIDRVKQEEANAV